MCVQLSGLLFGKLQPRSKLALENLSKPRRSRHSRLSRRADVQVDVEDRDSRWRHTRDSASLSQRLRTNAFELLLDLVRKAWDLSELELRRDAPGFGLAQPD